MTFRFFNLQFSIFNFLKFTINSEFLRYHYVYRRIILTVALSVFAIIGVKAQYDVPFSHYWDMEPYYNPAAVGKESKLNLTAAYALNFVGFEHNPRTMYASGDMPFYLMGSYHGVGLQFTNDAIGLFSHRLISLQYAFKRKMFGGTLSIGLQGTLITETFDGGDLDVETANDPAFVTSEIKGNGFDLGAGLYYHQKNWYVGASVLHALAPRIELGENNQLDIARSYYFTAGCNIRLRNPLLSLHPSVLGRSDGVGYRADVTTRLKYTHEERVMYVGVGYSPTNSFTVMLGGNFHGITLGYSYEIFTNGVSIGNGSHELFVGYQTDVNLFKKGRNRHQSVRIL